jgi:hypothetical protein
MIRKYEKLVRDKIPDVIKQDGRSYQCEVLDDKRYREELDKKLLEEATEFVQDHSVEEMADLWEVIEAIMKNRKISKEQVEEVKRKKQEKRGAFDKKLFLIEAEEKKD